MGKCGCKIVLKSASMAKSKSFPFNDIGLRKAMIEAEASDGPPIFDSPGPTSIKIVCNDGEIKIATCKRMSWKTSQGMATGPLCFMSPSGKGNVDIASGAVDKFNVKPKKPRRKIPKSQQSPAQRRFAEAAADCKGTPGKGGYRTCMARTLSGLKKRK